MNGNNVSNTYRNKETHKNFNKVKKYETNTEIFDLSTYFTQIFSFPLF